jgi:hypothetical protein
VCFGRNISVKLLCSQSFQITKTRRPGSSDDHGLPMSVGPELAGGLPARDRSGGELTLTQTGPWSRSSDQKKDHVLRGSRALRSTISDGINPQHEPPNSFSIRLDQTQEANTLDIVCANRKNNFHPSGRSTCCCDSWVSGAVVQQRKGREDGFAPCASKTTRRGRRQTPAALRLKQHENRS